MVRSSNYIIATEFPKVAYQLLSSAASYGEWSQPTHLCYPPPHITVLRNFSEWTHMLPSVSYNCVVTSVSEHIWQRNLHEAFWNASDSNLQSTFHRKSPSPWDPTGWMLCTYAYMCKSVVWYTTQNFQSRVIYYTRIFTIYITMLNSRLLSLNLYSIYYICWYCMDALHLLYLGCSPFCIYELELFYVPLAGKQRLWFSLYPLCG